MERAPNVVSLSGSFILENLAGILMVTLILILFRFYFSANNIKIEKQKTKVKRVLLVEKMENILENAKKTISSPESCMLNNKKEIFMAFDSKFCSVRCRAQAQNYLGKYWNIGK